MQELQQQNLARPSAFKVDAVMASVVFLWGINNAIVKGALVGWDPLAFNAVRFTGAALTLFLYVVLTDREWRLRGAELRQAVLLGFVGNGIYQWLYMEAISRTTASNVALLLALSPLTVTIWGGLIGLDKLTRWVFAGTTISVTGVALVLLGKSGGFSLSGETLFGDLIALVSVFCWAGYTVYARPVIQRVGSAVRVTAWTMLVGAVFNFAVGLPALLAQDFSTVSLGSVAGMTYSALFSLVYSYVAYAWAVGWVGGARTVIYLNLVPLIAAVTGMLFLGEMWNGWQWLGALLAIGGVTLAKLEGLR